MSVNNFLLPICAIKQDAFNSQIGAIKTLEKRSLANNCIFGKNEIIVFCVIVKLVSKNLFNFAVNGNIVKNEFDFFCRDSLGLQKINC